MSIIQQQHQVCQTQHCKNPTSTINFHEGDAPREYCEECYKVDQDDDEEVTGWLIYDVAWNYDTTTDDFDQDQDNEQYFKSHEEAMAEFKRRCTEYVDPSNEVSSVYLEEMGTDEDGDIYPIDTIEYWERISQEEHKEQNK